MTRVEMFIIATILLVLGLCAAPFVYSLRYPCLRGHTERRHHAAWTQFIMVGKVMVPVYHAAYDSEDFICDERAK